MNGHKCVKINNTHTLHRKKSESYEKSANTHSTYYVCAYVKFKIMRLHLHRINIDKNFVCSIYVYGSRKCTITNGSIPSCSDDLVLSSIIAYYPHNIVHLEQASRLLLFCIKSILFSRITTLGGISNNSKETSCYSTTVESF